MTEQRAKINPEALVSALKGATVDPATRKVRIGDTLFTPAEVRDLANAALDAAEAVESPTTHRAGDVFLDGSSVFISDGVVLWRASDGAGATPKEWGQRGYDPRLAYGPNGRPLGDIILDAIEASW